MTRENIVLKVWCNAANYSEAERIDAPSLMLICWSAVYEKGREELIKLLKRHKTRAIETLPEGHKLIELFSSDTAKFEIAKNFDSYYIGTVVESGELKKLI